MKKEKKVRTYQRRTKSGKMITVRAHTASYEAAEKAKEAAKKKGAGEELSSKVKKGEEWKLPMDEFLKKLKEERAQRREDEDTKKVEDEKPKKKSEKKTEKKTPAKKRTVGTGTNGPEPKKKTTTKKTAAKTDTSEPAFTRDEFKEWYRGTGSAADKKVAKALRKQLGRSGYSKFEDEAINNYTSRGHLSMFKRVSGGSSASTKNNSASVSTKITPKVKGDKLPSVGQKVSLKNWMGGKAQSYEVVGVQKATKAAKDESGLQNWLWVKDKKGNIHAATQEEDGRIGIDSTWTDFTDSKSHPYANSLRKAGYSLRKKSGSGGEYWDVVKTTQKSKVSKPTLSKNMSENRSNASTQMKEYKKQLMSAIKDGNSKKIREARKGYMQAMDDSTFGGSKASKASAEKDYQSVVKALSKAGYDEQGYKKRSVGTGTNGPEKKEFTESQLRAYGRKLVNARNKYIGGPGPDSYRRALKKRQEALAEYHKTDEGKAMMSAYRSYTSRIAKQKEKEYAEKRRAKKVEDAKSVLAKYGSKESSSDLRARADKMDADAKRAAIVKKIGSSRFRTIKNININVVKPNTRTAQLKGTLYVSSDKTKAYYEGSDGKLKKATKSILERYVHKK